MTETTDQVVERLAKPLLDLNEAGRIMHHTWTNGKRAQGFVGPFDICPKTGLRHCDRFPSRHDCKYHADLIGWDDLPQQQKDFNLNAFRGVFDALRPKLEVALREALRIGREQAAQTVELIWKHGNVVFSREARDELQYAIRYPEKSDELAAIRNLSTEE